MKSTLIIRVKGGYCCLHMHTSMHVCVCVCVCGCVCVQYPLPPHSKLGWIGCSTTRLFLLQHNEDLFGSRMPSYPNPCAQKRNINKHTHTHTHTHTYSMSPSLSPTVLDRGAFKEQRQTATVANCCVTVQQRESNIKTESLTVLSDSLTIQLTWQRLTESSYIWVPPLIFSSHTTFFNAATMLLTVLIIN